MYCWFGGAGGLMRTRVPLLDTTTCCCGGDEARKCAPGAGARVSGGARPIPVRPLHPPHLPLLPHPLRLRLPQPAQLALPPLHLHRRRRRLLLLLPAPPGPSRDPPCLPRLLLQAFLQLGLLPFPRVGAHVPAGEDRVQRGVLDLRLRHRALEVHVEALLGEGVVQLARVGRRGRVRDQGVRRRVLPGDREGFELGDAVEEGAVRGSCQSDPTGDGEDVRTCVHSAIALRVRPRCEAR